MARRNSIEEVNSAWRALAGEDGGEGWRTIPIEPGGPYRMLAARRFPGGEEALLVGFRSAAVPPRAVLPQGRGFTVARTEFESESERFTWLALSRQPAGSLDLFTMMVEDLLRTLRGIQSDRDEAIVRLFLERIHAWQEFMRRGDTGQLGPEAEIGLFGELIILNSILDLRGDASAVLAAWQGPVDGLQDFLFASGAIEVKSTVGEESFLANVGSLDQLDDAVHPVYLAAVRLAVDNSGSTLPDLVGDIRSRLQSDAAASGILASRLLSAGYLDLLADHYTRRFALVSVRVFPVTVGFPRLTRSSVPRAVRNARYELDIQQVAVPSLTVEEVLNQTWTA